MYVPSFCVCVCCVCTFRLFIDSPQNSSYSFICWYCLHICMGLKKKLTLRLCVQFQCFGALSALPGLGSLLAHVINALFFFPSIFLSVMIKLSQPILWSEQQSLPLIMGIMESKRHFFSVFYMKGHCVCIFRVLTICTRFCL